MELYLNKDHLNFPFTSIITAHYNTPERLFRLYNSLKYQTFPGDRFEWIIVDDGSPQGAPDLSNHKVHQSLRAPWCPSWINSQSSKLHFKLIQLSENQGRAKARNQGLKVAAGEILAFLDADMEVPPSWLEIIVRAVMECNGVVVGRLKPHPHLETTAFLRYYHTRGAAKLPPGAQIPGKYFVSSNAALLSKWLSKVGGFDESFPCWGGEDLDLGLRLEHAGAKIYSEPRAWAFHYHTQTWEQTEKRYLEYGALVVPVLLKRYSEAEHLLNLDLLRPPEIPIGLRQCLIRTIVTSLTKPKIYRIFRWLTTRCKHFPWCDLIFDFMIFYLYSRKMQQFYLTTKGTKNTKGDK